jgi:hypothetical protein
MQICKAAVTCIVTSCVNLFVFACIYIGPKPPRQRRYVTSNIDAGLDMYFPERSSDSRFATDLTQGLELYFSG